MKRKQAFVSAMVLTVCLVTGLYASEQTVPAGEQIYQSTALPPTASKTALKVGDEAPDFVLPSISGTRVTLDSYRGKSNVVLSFVPAAWTPVCSQQWPGYNIAKELFDERNVVVIGISVDNIPTLHAWVIGMGGLWFPVLSDFWPHGEVAKRYGVLRQDGVSERALFVIDKRGVVRYLDVHDINTVPRLEDLVKELRKLGP